MRRHPVTSSKSSVTITAANSSCFALLDDCDASAAAPRSRLYTGFLGALDCPNVAALRRHCARLQRQPAHTVVLLSYELGAAMHSIDARTNAGAPGSQLLLFSDCTLMSAAQVDTWLTQRADTAPAGIAGLHANRDAQDFAADIDRIRAYIAAGDTYQVNYTYRLRFETYGNLFTLYARLRARQAVPYGALIGLPDGSAIVSLSPELFVRHQGGVLTARPMKGTAAASDDATLDAERASGLASDPKNRAENLMIVDLLRNDLGQVAETGSVQVPALFAVQRYGAVLQMTSTITAQLREDVDLAELLIALFPCGSITGAPKRRTMQIIRALEPSPRGLYTGAIGWLAPAAPAASEIGVAAFCLSVPIRTLVLQAPDAARLRHGEMGVGAGIVYDSVAADEWAECALKASFLTGLAASFELFETMAVSRDGGCRLLARHLARLQRSAGYFQFVFDAQAAQASVLEYCVALPDDGPYRLRATLRPSGALQLHSSPLAPITTPLRLLLATEPTDADALFLRHKTSVRAAYDRAWQDAEARGAFDQLFCNQRGEVTEGGRSTLLVQIDGMWWTPALSCGVLPGVMREELMADPAWQLRERVLTLAHIRSAQSLMLCNALRGALPAVLVD